MNKHINVMVRVYDSLGIEVAHYFSKLNADVFERLEWDEDTQSYLKDCEIDGELGCKEIRVISSEVSA